MLSPINLFSILIFLKEAPLCIAKSSSAPFLSGFSNNEGISSLLPSSSSTGALPPPDSVQLKPRIINFNIMVAGLSGLGKTTLCEALLESWAKLPTDKARKKKKPSGQTMTVTVSDPLEWHDVAANTILRVRIIDTPGFGNKINHRNSVQTIRKYIQSCRREQLANERSVHASSHKDEERLVHVCLYFLSPGRFLEIDRHFLQNVQHDLQIVPLIAKADTLTNEEIAAYRAMIKKAFRKDKIQVYDFDDNQDKKITTTTKDYYNRGRRKGEALAIIARDGIYPWGKARALDPNHSDLKLIRDLLLSEHTELFLEKSQHQYWNYRARQIRKMKLVGALKYVALGGLSALKFATYLDVPQSVSNCFQGFNKTRKEILDRLENRGTRKESNETTEVEGESISLETDQSEDNSDSASERSSSLFLWDPRNSLGLFGTPPFNKSSANPQP